VQVTLHRPESFVELYEELDNCLDVRCAELPVTFEVGFLVFLAEDPQLGKGLRAFVVCRHHPLVAGQLAELHEKAAGELGGLRLTGEKDLVQHFFRGKQLALADPVEQGKDVLFLRMVDVLLDALQRDHGTGTEKQRKPLAFHAHVARIVLHHVQEMVHRLGGNGDLPLPEPARHPALLLIVEHLPEDLLVLKGHGAGGLLPLVSRDLPVDVPCKSCAEQQQGRISRGTREVLHQRSDFLSALHILGV